MSAKARNMKSFTMVVAASELPERVLSRFPRRPSAKARFTITVEPEESEAEKLAALERDLRAGLDDLAAGRTSEGSAVFTRLKGRFPGR